MNKEDENTMVTDTDDLPESRSEAAIRNVDRTMLKHCLLPQIINAPDETTHTGVFLCVVEPSPTCTSENKRRQPETRLPPPKQQLPHNETKTYKASPGLRCSFPSTTPRRCCSAHRNDTANNVSRSHDSVPTPPTINRKQFVLRPKQSSQHRCSSLEQTRACLDRSWYRRQAAGMKTNAVSPKRASPRTRQQPHQKSAPIITWP
jgi:hypothetical protein